MSSVLKERILIGLFLCFAAGMQAFDGSYVSNSSCEYNECCSCFNLQVQAGIAPIIWSQRNTFSAISCNASLGCPNSTVGPVVPLFEMPKFNNLYKLPWTVGGLIGYNLTDCFEVYVAANYRQANAKNDFTVQPTITLPLFVARPQFVFNSLSKYRFYDFYVGGRYYFNPCWCSCASFFLGGQIGLVHHKEVNFRLITSSLSNACAATFTSDSLVLFGKRTNVAGGGNLGLQYCWCDCVTFVLTAEVIATCGPCANITNIAFAGCVADQVLPELRPLGFIVGGSSTQIFFPITLGLKYSF